MLRLTTTTVGVSLHGRMDCMNCYGDYATTHQARSIALPIYKGKLTFMEGITTNYNDFIEAKAIMRLETKKGLWAFFKTTIPTNKKPPKVVSDLRW